MEINVSNWSDSKILRWIRENKRLEPDSEISASYLCSKCRELLIDPLQTECGCRYCKDCLQEHKQSGNLVCLNQMECDNKSLEEGTIEDRAAYRDIQRISIKCPFNDCMVKGEVRTMKRHMEECKHVEYECASCKELYSKTQEKDHLEKWCLKRMVMCEFCKEKIQFDLLEKEHQNTDSVKICHLYRGPCPHGCGDVVIYNHKEVCQKSPIKCPFPDCHAMYTKESINTHLHEENYVHLSKFIQLNLIKNDEIKALSSAVDAKIEEIEALKKSCAEMRGKENDRDRKFSSLQQSRGNSSMASVRRTIFRKGKLIWKIENFKKLKATAESGVELSRLSEHFYSSEFGYKLCMKIYPAGDGSGYKTHLSVYFVVMRGEYDDLQSWPFKNKVTLSILSSNKNHSETFKPDPNSPCYKKPTEECNIASGSPMFIKFDDLSKYLTDDSLYLQMFVNPN